ALISAVKRLYGVHLRARTWRAQRAEIYSRLISYNIGAEKTTLLSTEPYRSLKCFRDGNTVGARLEAAYSVQFFFDVLFGIHNGRLRPYYKYLEWEMKRWPLKKIPMRPKTMIRNVMKILETADIRTQQRMLRMLEKVMRKEGYGKVFDNWGDSLVWMKSFRG
ncbi:MAG: hypothetical protein KJ709_03490, partial [Nanoarchaeota archaeon]|nr:hypothetical protein [Nanoarchaeota archaeon]